MDNTAARVAELKRLLIMNSSSEQAYDDITRAAADVCEVPIALISLVDDHRQWFKSRLGTQAEQTPIEDSFCAIAIDYPTDTMVIRDALLDPRFAQNALVLGDPNIRFYAGVPLVTGAGVPIGTVCVIDRTPRDLSAGQIEQLKFFARQVVAMLEARPSPETK